MSVAVSQGFAQDSKAAFTTASDEFFDQLYFPNQPTLGTLTGYHQYDSKLEDFSRKSIDAEITALHDFEKRIAAIPDASLDQTTRGDRELVLSNIRTTLLTLEVIRPWEKNPDSYSGAISNAAFSLMERKFAPAEERLRSLIAREKLMPRTFVAARENLRNPPHVYTDIAIEQLPGIISFFQHDVPLAFADVKDAELNAEFGTTNAAVIAALNDYQSWLKTDLLPRSTGEFRIGADTFRKKLAYDEMVDTPLDKLLEIGQADLNKNKAEFNRIAKELEPEKDPRAVLDELGQNHPAPDQLLQSFRDTFNGLISFIRAKNIVTIPSDVRPILEETPPFMRATTFASMDTPGPFEKHATEAYFNVTLPEASMTPAEVEGYMHAFNIGTVISTAVHEAYPGHYVQFLWVPRAPSRVRISS